MKMKRVAVSVDLSKVRQYSNYDIESMSRMKKTKCGYLVIVSFMTTTMAGLKIMDDSMAAISIRRRGETKQGNYTVDDIRFEVSRNQIDIKAQVNRCRQIIELFTGDYYAPVEWFGVSDTDRHELNLG